MWRMTSSSRYILRRRSALWIANFSRNEDQTTDILYCIRAYYEYLYDHIIIIIIVVVRVGPTPSLLLHYYYTTYACTVFDMCVCARRVISDNFPTSPALYLQARVYI